MAKNHDDVRILALVRPEQQERIRRQLTPVGVSIDFIAKAADLSGLGLSQNTYQVALLPASLPDNDWWPLWGYFAVLSPRPEILVYAHTASFQLWSGVLDLGGYDVIIEPFTGEELQAAILRAARSFEERCAEDNGRQ